MDDLDTVLARLRRQLLPEHHSAVEAAALVAQAEALTATSDAGAPAELLALAVVAGLAGHKITAIQRANWYCFEPETPIPDLEQRVQWGLRRLMGKRVDPPCVRREHHGWALRTPDNPVILANWVKDGGYVASVPGPGVITVELP